MRYRRHLSPPFRDCLLPSGPLRFLLTDYRGWIPDDPNALDPHLREGDCLTFYHGTTKLLSVAYLSNEQIRLAAAPAYGGVSGFPDLTRCWSKQEWEQLQAALPLYLQAAVNAAGDGYYRNRREGFWQNRLSLAFGSHWRPGMDWLVIDREAVVGFNNAEERAAIQDVALKKYQDARTSLQVENPSLWGKPDGKGFCNEDDLLALGPDGELFCIESKHGTNASGIYWGCLQVAGYRDIFQQAVSSISGDLEQLVQQKCELGLLPAGAKSRWM